MKNKDLPQLQVTRCRGRHLLAKIAISALFTIALTLCVPPLVQILALTLLGNRVFLLVPYSTISFCFIPLSPPNNPIPIAIDYLQCAIYGTVLGQAWIRELLPKTVLWLAATHTAAILAAISIWQFTGLVWPF